MLSWYAWRAATAVHHHTPSEIRGARGEQPAIVLLLLAGEAVVENTAEQ
jgi:hypothetical protein